MIHTSYLTVLRWVSMGLGLALFLWLPFEDSELTWIFVFTLALCLILAAYLIHRLSISKRASWLIYPLSGILAGFAYTPAAFILMSIKTGLHGHGSPDFSPAQVEFTLKLTPLWPAAGLLVGLGAGLIKK